MRHSEVGAKRGLKEESPLTFWTGTAVPVGVDILACDGRNVNVMTVLSSFGILLPD